jgi:hypothetical protein
VSFPRSKELAKYLDSEYRDTKAAMADLGLVK